MHIEEISLRNYRNYSSLTLALEPGLTVVSGDNGQGKTNLLEAICLLSGRSPIRFGGNSQLVRWGSETASVAGRARVGGVCPGLRVSISASGRRLDVNNTRARSLAQSPLQAALFCPDTLSLVKEGAQGRRDLVDGLLERLQPAYRRLRADYARVLRQRNKVLQHAGRDAELGPWDTQLVELGSRIALSRAALVRRAGPHVSASYAGLSGKAEPAAWARYESGLLEGDDEEESVAARFTARLRERRDEERARGVTVVGPHRDDVVLELGGRALREFGSQGEQRCAALALVLAEAGLLEESAGERPVLLLDDVLSELDEARRRRLVESVAANGQTIMTTTRADDSLAGGAGLVRIAGGEVVDG
ncbi:MAG: DNA replication and repair protein RecF [Actinobacteria bacterium]|nr:MAG: DNA replication and repair protein RecF [Actinomycetota bacterium]